MRTSDRMEQAIYDAVHEVIMQLRIRLSRGGVDNIDSAISQAGHQAGMAAISAYRKPLPRKKP
jgi:hypothetical protein